ncbi:MAG: hypothetical protein ACRDO2_04070 [Nocardioidaceae bacterium]
MGSLDDLRPQVKAIEAVQTSGAVTPILNPTPQEQIDRMWPNGHARGVVTAICHEMAAGTRALRKKVRVTLRGRLPGGGFTGDTTVTAWLHWRVAAMLEPGLEVPVEVDPSSARVTGLATRRLAVELELPGLPKRASVATKSEDQAPKGDEALLAPIEGVTLEMLARIHVAMASAPLPPGGIEAVAIAGGVPDGRWEVVDGAWRRRIHTDAAVASRFRVALEAARGELG